MGLLKFSQIELFDAKLPKLEPGKFTLTIDKVMQKQTRDYGTACIVEVTVDSSDNTENPVGTKASWFQPEQAKLDYGKRRIKSFLLSTLGVTTSNAEAVAKIEKQKVTVKMDDGTSSEEDALDALYFEAYSKGVLNGKKIKATVEKNKNGFNELTFSPV
jgi:hypothetical protein